LCLEQSEREEISKGSCTVQKQYPFFKIMITHDSKLLMGLKLFFGKDENIKKKKRSYNLF